MKIKDNVLARASQDEVLIAKIAVELGKSPQTIKLWLQNKSIMTTLYAVYSAIQREYKLSDKELWDKK